MKLQTKLANVFNKNTITEEEKFINNKLRNMNKKKRDKYLILYDLAKQGKMLIVGKDVDNKKILMGITNG